MKLKIYVKFIYFLAYNRLRPFVKFLLNSDDYISYKITINYSKAKYKNCIKKNPGVIFTNNTFITK